MTIRRSPEAAKAWSQNLGHEHVLTTFTSYGAISGHRQAEIFQELRDAGSWETVQHAAATSPFARRFAGHARVEALVARIEEMERE